MVVLRPALCFIWQVQSSPLRPHGFLVPDETQPISDLCYMSYLQYSGSILPHQANLGSPILRPPI